PAYDWGCGVSALGCASDWGAGGAAGTNSGAVGAEAGPGPACGAPMSVGAAWPGWGSMATATSAAVGGGTLSEPMEARIMREGLAGGSPRSIASTYCMPLTTRPNTVYLLSSVRRGTNMMKNWLLAVSGSLVRAAET